MPKINVLPKSVAELIAAGEVVERPMSVVKELMENSIDAGADNITVEIKSGGIKYIRVTDNGCGIGRDDVRTAFISHATSKISGAEDLSGIFTLGFRGEALPSIAAVSKMTLLTCAEGESEGTSFSIEGGTEVSFDPAGCPVGTTMIVKDLFYNTPARMKFLKKDVTEGNYISDVVAKTALSHPEIRFSFIRDEKRVLSTQGNGDLLAAVYSVFGKEVSDALIGCRYDYDGIEVTGFISRPLNNRPNRNMQYFFVNGRCVRVPAAAPALDNAYKNSIMVGKFPMCFLNISVDVTKTDVNVHPAKTEIRFSDDSKIYEAVFYAARAALNSVDTKRPEVKLGKKDVLAGKQPENEQLKIKDIPAPHEKKEPLKSVIVPDSGNSATVRENVSAKTQPAESGFGQSRGIDIVYEEKSGPETFSFSDGAKLTRGESAVNASMRGTNGSGGVEQAVSAPEKIPEKTGAVPEKSDASAKSEKAAEIPVYIIGEVFKTYIIAEYGDRLLIIDKHAAHERMIYNELVNSDTRPDSQRLLSPAAVALSGKEYSAVIDNLDIFEKAGFEVEDFGNSTVLVRACPVRLEDEDVSHLITEIAGELARGNNSPQLEKLEWLYSSSACRAAVKAGDELKPAEMLKFVERLVKDEDIRYCPHGRPVMYELSKREIEKQFGRIT